MIIDVRNLDAEEFDNLLEGITEPEEKIFVAMERCPDVQPVVEALIRFVRAR